jgi:hypothetical protein
MSTAYSSFSGIDIIAVIEDTPIATLQGISYSITREKAPIYTFGHANPRSFSRGKRGLAGSMIFTLFDRSALYQIMAGDQNGRWDYYAKEGEGYSLEDNNADPWAWAAAVNANTPGQYETTKRHAEFMDQIMPFNITLIAQNEYGLAAWKAILGIEILNEGGGLSVDDITNEEQTTYVAKQCTAWVPIAAGASQTDGSDQFLSPGAGQPDASETNVFPASADTLSAYNAWLLGNDAGAANPIGA